MVPASSNFSAFLRSEGEGAVRELCGSLESTRRLLAERAGQAEFETTGLEPLPQDRMSLAFVQAVLKHNLSPSNIQDAILALKDFQFEVESCQQTTELAFQQVWRVYEILRSRTLQIRSSISTISTISSILPESSTGPQVTTSFRKEVVDWLMGQDVAVRSTSGARNATAKTEEKAQPSTSAEENTSTSMSQHMSASLDQEMPRTAKDRIRNIFGLSTARKAYKKIKPFRVEATGVSSSPYNLPRYGPHHSQNNASIDLILAPPARNPSSARFPKPRLSAPRSTRPLSPRLAASRSRHRTRSPRTRIVVPRSRSRTRSPRTRIVVPRSRSRTRSLSPRLASPRSRRRTRSLSPRTVVPHSRSSTRSPGPPIVVPRS